MDDLTPSKRKTRIKVFNAPKNSPVNIPSVKVEEDESVFDDHDEKSLSADEGTLTYEVEKPIMAMNPDENVDDETDGDDMEEEENDGIVPTVVSPPMPAPRNRNIVTHQENKEILIELPTPLPRNSKPEEETTVPIAVKTDGQRKKKRKAAEMISNVLKLDGKKLPGIATIFQESEEGINKEKDEHAEDIGSPWDSPPAPQQLSKVYVQHKHGFSVKDWAEVFKTPEAKTNDKNRCLTSVALGFYDLWTRLMTFSHGVVAGIACCHILAVAAALASTEYSVPQFVQFYHFLSLKVHFAIYIFTTMCIVSCFDRLDVAQLSKSHLHRMAESPCTLMVTFGYLVSMILSLVAHRHTAAIEAYKSNPELWDSQGLHEWHWLVTSRDILLLIAWICITLSPSWDLLRDKLAAMDNHPSPRVLWRLPAAIHSK